MSTHSVMITKKQGEPTNDIGRYLKYMYDNNIDSCNTIRDEESHVIIFKLLV